MHHEMQPWYEMDASGPMPGLFVISKRNRASPTAQNENGQLFARCSQYTVNKVFADIIFIT